VVPGSLELSSRWKDFPGRKVIHAPHLAHNFNLADKSLSASNRKIFCEVQNYADSLSSDTIICHGGTGGNVEESIRQLAQLHDERIILENKPFWQHPEQYPDGEDLHCRGAVFEEFKYMLDTLKLRCCHDLAHTVCMSNSLKLDWEQEIKRFETLRPKIHHLSDLQQADDELDMHTALGSGELDWRRALELIAPDSWVTLETPKRSPDNLDDFAFEVRMIKAIFA